MMYVVDTIVVVRTGRWWRAYTAFVPYTHRYQSENPDRLHAVGILIDCLEKQSTLVLAKSICIISAGEVETYDSAS